MIYRIFIVTARVYDCVSTLFSRISLIKSVSFNRILFLLILLKISKQLRLCVINAYETRI